MKTNEMRLILSAAMKRKGIDQKELGRLLSISPRTVRKWMTGKCRFDEYAYMCEVLDLKLSILGPEIQMIIKGHFTVTNKQGNV